VQNNAINGHRFHKDARLADPVNITFRQAVTQQIMELGERSGIHLPFETVEKRVSVYLQNYREEAKKTPSELAADRRSKRLRSKQRRDEARQRRINEAAMQIQSIQQN
jgi:predicted DNA repair protein MutK